MCTGTHTAVQGIQLPVSNMLRYIQCLNESPLCVILWKAYDLQYILFEQLYINKLRIYLMFLRERKKDVKINFCLRYLLGELHTSEEH